MSLKRLNETEVKVRLGTFQGPAGDSTNADLAAAEANAAALDARNAATEARGAANAATTSASSVAGAVSDANNAAEQAKGAAGNAATAASSASSAASRANAAANAADTAAAQAQSATENAVYEANRASAAATAANTAEGAAQSAASSANSAAAQAVTAATAANEAAEDASSAAGEAGNAANRANAEAEAAAANTQALKDVYPQAVAATNAANAAAESANAAAASAQTEAGKAADAAAQADAAREGITDELGRLKDQFAELDESIYELVPIGTPVNSIPNSEYWASASNVVIQGINLGANTSDTYDGYWFVVEKDCELFFGETTSNYVSICIGRDFTGESDLTSNGSKTLYCSDAVRYRKSDGNLPTETSKIQAYAGDVIAISVTKGGTDAIYGVETAKIVKESFKEAVSLEKRKYLRYVQGDGNDSSTERVEVYIPAAVGYIRYDFLHCVSAELNADNWRIGYAYACDEQFNVRFQITTRGEWECAVHLKDRSDFSGGIAHGDEVLTDITFFVNGVPVDISAYTEITAFDSFSVIEFANLYDPTDNTTVIAEHGSEHSFAEDALCVSQNLRWMVSDNITNCYMAMHLPAKAVTNMWYSDYDFKALATGDDPSFIRKGAKKVCVYSADGAVKTEMEIAEYPTGYSGGDRLMMTDNSNNVYNKCYFVISTLSAGIPIEAGTEWRTKTFYRFEVGK